MFSTFPYQRQTLELRNFQISKNIQSEPPKASGVQFIKSANFQLCG